MASVSKRPWTYKGVTKSKWVVRYKDSGGQQRQETFEKKKDADIRRVAIESEVALSGRFTHVRPTTVDAAAREFLTMIDQRMDDGQVKRSYRYNVDQALRVSIVPIIGDMMLAEVDVATCERLYATMRSSGRLAATTARDRLGVLARLFTMAKRRGMHKGDNPATEAIAALGKPGRVRIRTLNPQQVGHLLATAAERGRGQHEATWRLTQVAVHIATFCGLRSGEILSLRLCDVDLERRRIRVAHTIDRWHDLTAPKTADSFREVPMPPHVADLIGRWLADGYIPNEQGALFRVATSRKGRAGAPLGAAQFNVRYWRPLTVRAGIHDEADPLHFHALRHFAGSWWLKNSLPVPDVAKLMGHADAAITMRIYSHAMSSESERSDALDGTAAALLSNGNAQGVHNGQKVLQYQR